MELLYLASQAPAGAEKKVRNCIELYAPWMQAEEVEAIVEHLAIIPDYQKAKTTEELGKAVHLINNERERLKLWSMKPCDVTEDEFGEQSKARSRHRREVKRRQQGVRSRSEYLAEVKAKPKPWDGTGLSRWQWYRRNGVVTDSRRVSVETIVKRFDHTQLQEQAARPQGLQGRGGGVTPREQAEVKQAESGEIRGSSADRPHLVAVEGHYLLDAMQNWGVNAERRVEQMIWSPPKILADEPRDFTRWPLDPEEYAA
jgi:hypothetical protein